MTQENQNQRESQPQHTVVQIGGFGISFGGFTSFIGRLLIATFFIASGVLAVMDFRSFSQMVSNFKLPAPMVLAVLGVVAKILGGILFSGLISFMGLGVNAGRLMLLIFTTVATVLAHNPVTNPGELSNALKNLGIIGGLLAA